MNILTFSTWNLSLMRTLGQIRDNGSRGLSLACRCVLFGLNVVFKIFGSYVNIVKSVEFT